MKRKSFHKKDRWFHSWSVTIQRSPRKKNNLPGKESCVAPLTILKGHQTTSRETADHFANSQKIP